MLTCRNISAHPFPCFRPGVEIFCNRFDEPSMLHSVAKQPLPDSWLFFKAGEETKTAFDFTAPDAAGDYCLLAVFTFRMQAQDNGTVAVVYSYGKLLRVGE
jgi:hypothetical protein